MNRNNMYMEKKGRHVLILVVNLTISDLTAVIKIVPLDHLLLLLDPLKEMEIFSNYKYQLLT